MKYIYEFTLAEILDITGVPYKDIDPMIYNVCDNAGLICPMSRELCDEQCRRHFEDLIEARSKDLSDSEKL